MAHQITRNELADLAADPPELTMLLAEPAPLLGPQTEGEWIWVTLAAIKRSGATERDREEFRTLLALLLDLFEGGRSGADGPARAAQSQPFLSDTTPAE